MRRIPRRLATCVAATVICGGGVGGWAAVQSAVWRRMPQRGPEGETGAPGAAGAPWMVALVVGPAVEGGAGGQGGGLPCRYVGYGASFRRCCGRRREAATDGGARRGRPLGRGSTALSLGRHPSPSSLGATPLPASLRRRRRSGIALGGSPSQILPFPAAAARRHSLAPRSRRPRRSRSLPAAAQLAFRIFYRHPRQPARRTL